MRFDRVVALFGAKENPFPDMTIAGVDDIERLATTPFTQIISVSDIELQQDMRHEHRVGEFYPNARILYCYFNDIDMPTQDGPTEAQIKRVLDFSKEFTKADKILIHCRAGISRSTALAFSIACQHSKPGEERKAFAYIRKIRPQLIPNRLIVITVDRLLKREGNMITASTPKGW